MKTSVIIPAANEESSIAALLAGIEKQTLVPDEVIVVDAGSTDATVAVARTAMTGTLAPQVDSIGPAYPGRARNHGAAVASGDLLVFIDAGHVVGPDWLAELTAPLRRGDADLSWGEWRPSTASPVAEALAAAIWPRSSVRRGVPNMAMTRQAFATIGGFRDDIRSGEDREWRRRLGSTALRTAEADGATAYYTCFPESPRAVLAKWVLFNRHAVRSGLVARRVVLTMLAAAVAAAAALLAPVALVVLLSAYVLLGLFFPVLRGRVSLRRHCSSARRPALALATRVAMDIGRTVGLVLGAFDALAHGGAAIRGRENARATPAPHSPPPGHDGDRGSDGGRL